MKRILVAVDGSEGANRAARFAARLAKDTGAVLELLHVYDAPTAAHLGLRALSKEELSERGESIARGSIDAAEKAIGGLVEAEHHLSMGHPETEIVLRAEEADADLIVLGSRGLRDLEGILLGSISRKVLSRSKRPVTVVP
jgi:nucleotide-binding universal stress UspA family protein